MTTEELRQALEKFGGGVEVWLQYKGEFIPIRGVSMSAQSDTHIVVLRGANAQSKVFPNVKEKAHGYRGMAT